MFSPGQLRHKVVLQSATTTRNAVGEPVQAWAKIVTTRANIEALSGKERYAAMQQQYDVDHKITVRYQAALASLEPNDRVIIKPGGKILDIRHVDNVGFRNRELQIYATLHGGISADLSVPESALLDVNGNPIYDAAGNYRITAD